MEEYGFFIGCTIPLKLPHLEKAFRDVASILGVKLREMEGVSCCPEPVSVFTSRVYPLTTGVHRGTTGDPS